MAFRIRLGETLGVALIVWAVLSKRAEATRTSAANAASEVRGASSCTIFVDATTGSNLTDCGTEKHPCTDLKSAFARVLPQQACTITVSGPCQGTGSVTLAGAGNRDLELTAGRCVVLEPGSSCSNVLVLGESNSTFIFLNESALFLRSFEINGFQSSLGGAALRAARSAVLLAQVALVHNRRTVPVPPPFADFSTGGGAILAVESLFHADDSIFRRNSADCTHSFASACGGGAVFLKSADDGNAARLYVLRNAVIQLVRATGATAKSVHDARSCTAATLSGLHQLTCVSRSVCEQNTARNFGGCIAWYRGNGSEALSGTFSEVLFLNNSLATEASLHAPGRVSSPGNFSRPSFLSETVHESFQRRHGNFQENGSPTFEQGSFPVPSMLSFGGVALSIHDFGTVNDTTVQFLNVTVRANGLSAATSDGQVSFGAILWEQAVKNARWISSQMVIDHADMSANVGGHGPCVFARVFGSSHRSGLQLNDSSFIANRAVSTNQAGIGGCIGVHISNEQVGTETIFINVTKSVFADNELLEFDESLRGRVQGGGAIGIQGTSSPSGLHVSVQGSIFRNNTSARDGGALAFDSEAFPENVTFVIRGNIFAGNRCLLPSGRGGALSIQTKEGAHWAILIEDSVFENNTVHGVSHATGGATSVLVQESAADFAVALDNCTFSRNQAAVSGGAVVVKIRVPRVGCRFVASRCSFTGNFARSSGGALFLDTQNAEQGGAMQAFLYQCRFQYNAALSFGGAIAVQCDNSTDHCELSVAEATSFIGHASMYGGAIWVHTCNLDIRNSSMHNNIAQSGAAIYMDDGGRMETANLSARNNTLYSGSAGGFLYASELEALHLREGTAISSVGATEALSVSSVPSLSAKFPGLRVACNAGMELDSPYVRNFTRERDEILHQLYAVSFLCQPCRSSTYTLLAGTNDPNVATARCVDPPTGAYAEGNNYLFAISNYICMPNADQSNVECYLCAAGYCCDETETKRCRYDECAPGRMGVLCTKCQDGYSRSLGTKGCVRNDECGGIGNFFVQIMLSFLYLALISSEARENPSTSQRGDPNGSDSEGMRFSWLGARHPLVFFYTTLSITSVPGQRSGENYFPAQVFALGIVEVTSKSRLHVCLWENANELWYLAIDLAIPLLAGVLVFLAAWSASRVKALKRADLFAVIVYVIKCFFFVFVNVIRWVTKRGFLCIKNSFQFVSRGQQSSRDGSERMRDVSPRRERCQPRVIWPDIRGAFGEAGSRIEKILGVPRKFNAISQGASLFSVLLLDFFQLGSILLLVTEVQGDAVWAYDVDALGDSTRSGILSAMFTLGVLGFIWFVFFSNSAVQWLDNDFRKLKLPECVGSHFKAGEGTSVAYWAFLFAVRAVLQVSSSTMYSTPQLFARSIVTMVLLLLTICISIRLQPYKAFLVNMFEVLCLLLLVAHTALECWTAVLLSADTGRSAANDLPGSLACVSLIIRYVPAVTIGVVFGFDLVASFARGIHVPLPQVLRSADEPQRSEHNPERFSDPLLQ